jgi:release factor glutamine methyltransferase
MFVRMSRKELYQLCYSWLKKTFDEGEASAMMKILTEYLKWPPADKFDAQTTEEEYKLATGIIERLCKHEPIQYITGTSWFYNMEFDVNPSVLIPRPETEELVHEAINFLKTLECPRILDIGTGSGCIPITIAKKTVACCVMSVDVSEHAISTAQSNAIKLKADVHLIEMDFLNEANWPDLLKFDCIISNPPYIPLSSKTKLEKNVVEYEPGLALFVEDDKPLLFYEAIMKFGKTHLEDKGRIFVELNQDLAEETKELFDRNGYTTTIKKDINDNPRILIATRSR